MPELPEVETIRKGLENLVGKKVTQVFRSQKKMRMASTLDLQGLCGAKILEINRRARYLVIGFENPKIPKQVRDDDEMRLHHNRHPELVSGKSLIIHLGMSGKITHSLEFRGLKHDHFACKFDDNSWLIFNDARRFGFVDLIETKNLKTHKMLARLGVEPLSSEFNLSSLREKLRGKKMNIKTAMMDNEIVVGVGNIYINESLFDAGISPLRSSSSLKENEIKNLVSSIKRIIKKAIKLGGSSISDYVDAKGDSGNFQKNFQVYGREKQNCLQCKNSIKRIVQNGRSSFYCSQCQG